MVSGDPDTDVMRMQCIYKTAETEAVKNDRPVLRTETGSEEKNFTVFAMDTVMQFQIYGGNDDVEEKVRGKIEELEDTLSVTKEGSPMWNLNEKKNENFAEEFANLMLQSLKLCKDTDGALDISAYPTCKRPGALPQVNIASPMRKNAKH